MLGQVAGSIGPESLFIRYRRQCQPSMQLTAQLAQVQKGENRGGGVRRLARVAGRIRALTANEAPEEIEQNLAVALSIRCNSSDLRPSITGSPIAFTRQVRGRAIYGPAVGRTSVGRDHPTLGAMPLQELTDVGAAFHVAGAAPVDAAVKPVRRPTGRRGDVRGWDTRAPSRAQRTYRLLPGGRWRRLDTRATRASRPAAGC